MIQAAAGRIGALPVGIGGAIGLGAWCSLGSIDLTTIDGRAVRIAMLPPVWQLGALILLATALTIAIAARLRDPAPIRPMFLAALPALPYLPGLADLFPILLMLAGPGKWLVWTIAAGETLRMTAAHIGRRKTPPGAGTAPPVGRVGAAAAAVFVAAALIFGAAAARLTRTAIYPGGDEPHYLVIMQSLWYDRDFQIENNHQRGDYEEYFTRQLAPHYLTRGADAEIYSIHPVGLPLLATPAYGLGGYTGVLAFVVALAALGGALLWREGLRLTGSAAAATFGWAAVCGSAPYLLHSFSIYPEIAAGVCALAILRPAGGAQPPGLAGWIWRGSLAAALPWLSTKYAPMAAALMLVLAGRIWRGHHDPAWRLRRLFAAGLPFGMGLLAWFGFFYWIWGTPSPTAPYGTNTQTSLLQLRTGFPGLLFDQEYGLFVVAPVLALGVLGLVGLWRHGRAHRVLAAEILLAEIALISTVGAFRIWWGGSAAPGRPMVSGLLLLGIPIAWHYARANLAVSRAFQHVLLLVSLYFTGVLVFAQQGLLMANDRDGSARLLEYLSPAWAAWSVAPSFIYHRPWTGGGIALAWVLLAAACVVLLRRLERTRPAWTASGRASIVATTGILAVALSASASIQAVAAPLLQPPVDLARRGRVRLLEEFDASRRPLALAYDPLRRLDAAQVPSLFALGVRRPADARTGGGENVQLLGARFTLPAGEYLTEFDLGPETNPSGQWAGVQVGRAGATLEVWDDAPPIGIWRGRFRLPVDVGYVVFRGPAALDRRLKGIRLTPVSLVDAAARVETPEIIGARRYGGTLVLSHDGRVALEEAGFWIPGAATAQVTIVQDERPLRLRFHSGATSNTVRFSGPGLSRRVELEPGNWNELPLPDVPGGIVRLTIATDTGFVPALLDPASKDRRHLGVWVELGK